MTFLLLLKSLCFLVAIVLLIYLCLFWYKRKMSAALPSRRIKIIEQRAVDQKTTITLAQIDDAEMIIVSGPQGIALCSENYSARTERNFKNVPEAMLH